MAQDACRSPVMPTAPRVAHIEPFEVMEVMTRAQALEAAGRRVLHMEIGEPDFTAPAPVVEAAAKALRDGLTAYTPALGIAPLREAIARYHAAHLGAEVDAERIAVTAGASGALLLTLALYVSPGDEILVPDPGYPAYRHLVRAFEGSAKALPVGAATRFQPDAERVRASWGPRTRALLLGTPSNPTGTLIERETLERIAEFVAAQGGLLIVDETYQGLVYGRAPASAALLPGEVVAVNSFSKYFCMTGWRLGWSVLPAARVRDFEKLAQHFFICPSSLAQRAALAAFVPETLRVLEQRRREFERRRDFIVPALQRAGLGVPVAPEGAFYVFADCTAYGNAHDFTLRLLEREAVAATPGSDFGAHGTAGFVRVAYTREMNELEEAAARLARFCRGST
jgi:aspartate/methionine/tyrosine aminotransferase